MVCRVLRICFWIWVCCDCSLSRRHCCSTSIFTARPKLRTSEPKLWIWSWKPLLTPASWAACCGLGFPSVRGAPWLPGACMRITAPPGDADVKGACGRLERRIPTRRGGWGGGGRERTDSPGLWVRERLGALLLPGWFPVTVCVTLKTFHLKWCSHCSRTNKKLNNRWCLYGQAPRLRSENNNFFFFLGQAKNLPNTKHRNVLREIKVAIKSLKTRPYHSHEVTAKIV